MMTSETERENNLTTTAPRTLRELEQMPTEEAIAYWERLSGREQTRLANAMTSEEIENMPAHVKDFHRTASITGLSGALHELDAEGTAERGFWHEGPDGDVAMTEDYCRNALALLTDGFDDESEETLGFYNYHNQRFWIESYEFLLKEYEQLKKD